MNLHLFNFNNYYNRINRQYSTLKEYIDNGTLLKSVINVNFNPNDGVTTIHDLNYTADQQPDYLIAADDYDNIVSRWFVIEAVRNRGGQYKVSLLRDVVTDFYSVAVGNPCFIEKATLKKDDPAIFNKQNMTFNQIRQNPRFMFDKSQTPWVVGYVPRDAFETTVTVDTSAYNLQLPDDTVSVNNLEDWDFYKYTTDGASGDQYGYIDYYDILIDGYYAYLRNAWNNTYDTYNARYSPLRYERQSNNTYQLFFSDKVATYGEKGKKKLNELVQHNANADNASKYFAVNYSGQRGVKVLSAGQINLIWMGELCYQQVNGLGTRLDTIKNELTERIGIVSDNISELESKVGTTIQEVSSGRIFRVVGVESSSNLETNLSSTATTRELTRAAFEGCVSKMTDWLHESYNANQSSVTGSVPGDSAIKCGYKYTTYKLVLEQLAAPCSVEILAADDRTHAIDAPYDMFCMPLNSMKMVYDDMPPFGEEGDYFFTSKTGYSIPLATAIAVQYGTNKVYDLQLLPFCPILDAITNFREVDLRLVSHSIIYDKTDAENPQKVGAMFWCRRESFSFTNDWDILIEPGKTALEQKINNETKFCRLCSPNGSGTFEFSPEMNGGVTGWKVACTYKPFQPFIQVRPIFGKLYGTPNEVDYRGLICGGDFSMAQLSNQWANYQQNNANYQAIFDREIQNLQVTQKVQRTQQIIGGVTSVIGGAASGAAGGAAGAIVGAARAALTSGINYGLSEVMRDEALDYKQDMFGYQLGNIQAIPTSISKTAANVITNPLVPYVEFYDCTEEQRQALADKLYYNGMSVGRIGYIQDYIGEEPSYIKGKLIRVEGLQDDTHLANALANELNKGVFL